MWAQWICSREQRIVLYKWSSINQSACLICVHVPVSVSPLCTCTCQCVCFMYMYLSVCLLYVHVPVSVLCVHVPVCVSALCICACQCVCFVYMYDLHSVQSWLSLFFLYCFVLFSISIRDPHLHTDPSIHVTSFMVSLLMTSSSFDYHHSFRIIYKYLKKRL